MVGEPGAPVAGTVDAGGCEPWLVTPPATGRAPARVAPLSFEQPVASRQPAMAPTASLVAKPDMSGSLRIEKADLRSPIIYKKDLGTLDFWPLCTKTLPRWSQTWALAFGLKGEDVMRRRNSTVGSRHAIGTRLLGRAGAVTVAMALVAGHAAMELLAPTPAFAVPPTITDINPNVSTSSDADATTGGRVNHIASVPGNNQIFYAASEQGGLFKTVNTATSWTHLDGHVPEVTWDVKVNPSTVNTVYATSFYDGKVNSISGIEISTDAGVTWTHPASATPGAGAHCSAVAKAEPAALGIGVRPDATNNVFIGTNCGLARSTDSGTNWDFVDPTPGTTNANKVWSVLPQAVGAQGTIQICGDDGFFRSTDGGATWIAATTAPPQGICSLTASPDENYVLFATASDNNAWESDDGGANWTSIGNFGDAGQGRIPFVTTNKRATNFDLWFGDVSLFRVACTTPATPAPGGASRCSAGTINGPFTRTVGGHDDLGSIVFNTAVAVDACPRLFSSDGGAHVNTNTSSPGCHNPTWNRANNGLHALWLFGMSGTDLAGAGNEGLFFGVQDDGFHATTTAGNNPPSWINPQCCDGFDVVSDANRTVNTICCFKSPSPSIELFIGNASGSGQTQVPNYPTGGIIGFTSTSSLVEIADKQYGVLTSSGLFITTDITVNPIVWTQLGAATSPANACGVSLATSGGTPTFFLDAGTCDATTGHQVWKFTGTGAGSWTRIDNNNGVTGGFGIFAVDPSNPNRLYASNIAPGGPRMIRSNDGGTTYVADPGLDTLMTGGGAFPYRNSSGPTNFTGTNGYVQPTLVAFDPSDANTLVAGGHDSGVFISRNNGVTWSLATDPFTPGTSGRPHLSQPRFAYFDHDGGPLLGLYIGTQGRGVWRIVPPTAPPPCTTTLTGDITGPLTVAPGSSLCIVNARVFGPISVASGGALTIANSQIYKGVSSTGATFVQICGTKLSPPDAVNPTVNVVNSTGSVTVGDAAVACNPNTIAGTTNLSSNGSDVTFGNNTTSAGVTVNNNTGAPNIIKGNSILRGMLACSGNTSPPTNAGQVNTVPDGKTGQCAGL